MDVSVSIKCHFFTYVPSQGHVRGGGWGGVGCIHEIDGDFEGRSLINSRVGGGFAGEGGSPPPPGRSYHRFYPYIHISIYPYIPIDGPIARMKDADRRITIGLRAKL